MYSGKIAVPPGGGGIRNNNGPVVWTRKIAAHKFTFWGHSVCVSWKKNQQNL
jgi:hypothetical protein